MTEEGGMVLEVGIHVQMSSFDFLFAHLGAFFCGVSTGAKRLMLSIGVLLGGAAAHAALSEDTMVGAENSAAAAHLHWL